MPACEGLPDIGPAAADNGSYPAVVGNGETIADQLKAWIENGEIDGFNVNGTWASESIGGLFGDTQSNPEKLQN